MDKDLKIYKVLGIGRGCRAVIILNQFYELMRFPRTS